MRIARLCWEKSGSEDRTPSEKSTIGSTRNVLPALMMDDACSNQISLPSSSRSPLSVAFGEDPARWISQHDGIMGQKAPVGGRQVAGDP